MTSCVNEYFYLTVPSMDPEATYSPEEENRHREIAELWPVNTSWLTTFVSPFLVAATVASRSCPINSSSWAGEDATTIIFNTLFFETEKGRGIYVLTHLQRFFDR